jgi:hypothetical protein
LALPLAPLHSPGWELTAGVHDVFREEIGWPELAAAVADIYHGLPAEEQAQTAILAGNYGEAGAVNLYGPAHGLPEAISGIIAQRLLRRRGGDNTYSGRIGVYELMSVDPLLRDAIRRNAPQNELEQLASQTGYRPMIDDARDKADVGLTDAGEIQRVLGD